MNKNFIIFLVVAALIITSLVIWDLNRGEQEFGSAWGLGMNDSIEAPFNETTGVTSQATS